MEKNLNKDNINLGDFRKPKYGWDKQQREDWLYMVLPSIVIGCLVAAAIFVGLLKLLVR